MKTPGTLLIIVKILGKGGIAMDKEKRSLFQRIRNARQSLDNAEKSFQDDKEMRGELDLMLAEAELKNLRNKKTFPWSWNRQSLAFCIAMLLAITGIGGWFYGREEVPKAELPTQTSSNNTEVAKTTIDSSKQVNGSSANGEAQKNIKSTTDTGKEKASSVNLSNKDIRQLVRSAKNELSNGK